MGDVEIKLGGKLWRLRPTFGAMREIEAACKSSCATLLQLLARQEMHSSEMALVVYWGMVEAGENPSDPEAIGNRLFEAGVASDEVRTVVADYLIELLFAPDAARKKLAGEWFRKTQAIISQAFSLAPMDSDGGPETSGEQLPENSGPSSRRSVKNPK